MDISDLQKFVPDRVYKKQAYWRSAGPFMLEQAGGRKVEASDWVSFCAECRQPFKFAKWEDGQPMTRRCEEHRYKRGGVWCKIPVRGGE